MENAGCFWLCIPAWNKYMVPTQDWSCICFYFQALWYSNSSIRWYHLLWRYFISWEVGYFNFWMVWWKRVLNWSLCWVRFFFIPVIFFFFPMRQIGQDQLTLFQNLCSVIGAAVIVTGFYSVMWGKVQEQKMGGDTGFRRLKSGSEKEPLLQNDIQEM